MIGKNIYKIRKQRGYTLSELAERTGISKSYLSNIERNLKQNPSIQVVEKIALVLKVELKTLLKLGTDLESKQQLEKEWIDFIYEMKKTGIDKERIHEYKILIEFMQWYNGKIQD
ncbi:helix-turn-helix domain-containing protein [Paenibacillus sp. LMG 31456]|uniref:Helix-turn-helix domain-containing protein n=1 Tax=Paenibacillus foliorum TaxID=2654974 RepID=A0A972GW02_9BACL|nr:helix-turn-helix transcriptional regulator [Paenibacillus foliorum]NOU97318.1 helix-turn-helix domain-containing protein [Paenibacillus foliorum]